MIGSAADATDESSQHYAWDELIGWSATWLDWGLCNEACDWLGGLETALMPDWAAENFIRRYG